MDRRKLLKCAGISAAGLMGAAHTSEAGVAALQGSTLNAVWIHGTTFEAEDPGALTGIQRVGWGTLFRGKPGKFTWFHVAIPTPVIVDNVRPSLEKVFVFYKTNGASIRNVHIYDGPRNIKSFDDLVLEGDRSGSVLPTNGWGISPPATLGFSLGISLGVQFSIGFDSVVTTEILFTTAGADFRLNRPNRGRDTIELTPNLPRRTINP